MRLSLETLTLGPIGANCHIAWVAGGRDALVVDPGDEADSVLETLGRIGAVNVEVWLTHAHIDHIGAAAAVRRATGAKVLVHESEDACLGSADLCGATWLGIPFEPCPSDGFLAEGMTREWLGRTWRFLHVPGHSPGSVLHYSAQDGLAFGGDLIFRGSVGRTDLPGGNPRTMSQSLRRVCTELPPETRLLVGHGPETTIALELASNPYVRLAVGAA